MPDTPDTLLTRPSTETPLLPPDAGESVAPLLAGDSFAGRYRVERCLGQGGFGQVWLAEHLATGDLVALKLLLARAQSDKMALAAFEQEIWALAAMEHPGIVKLLDEGTDEFGRRFCALELVEGGQLELGGQPLDLVLRIFDRILATLAYIHARGVIHRDLKPPNVHLSGELCDHDPKLLDFGIAYIGEQLAARLRMERVDMRGISAQYSSPEQFSGEGVGPATDLYSVGVILHEVLSGTLPFKGPTLMDFLLQHIAHPPPPLKLPEALSDLEALVMDLLAKKYGARPECAADVRLRLAEVLEDLPSPVPKTPEPPTEAPDEDGHTGTIIDLVTQDLDAFEPSKKLAATSLPWRVRRARPVPLVGRDEPCALLSEILDTTTRERTARCVLLVGPRGTGRRRLARWLSETAHEKGRARTLRVDLGAWPDLGTALRRAFLELLRFPAQDRKHLQTRIAATLPTLGEEDSDTKALVDFLLDQTEATTQRRLPALWSRICTRLAIRPPERPLLLWLDGRFDIVREEVAVWITSLLESARMTRWPLMVVMSTSPLDTSRPLTALLAHPQVIREPLGPLDPEASAQLIAHIEPDFSAEATEFLITHSQGLPFLIREQLDDWHEGGTLIRTEAGLTPTQEGKDLAARSIEALLSSRLELLLTEARNPAALSEALWHLALLGTAFSRRQAISALDGSGASLELLIRNRVLVPRDARPDAPLTFADNSLRQTLLNAAAASTPLETLVPGCMALRMMASLDALIASDWDLANRELIAAHRLLRAHPPSNFDALMLRLLDAMARVAFRKRDLPALSDLCTLLEAQTQTLSQTPLAIQAQAATGLWRGGEAIAQQNHKLAGEFLDTVCLLQSAPFYAAQAWSFRGMLALKDLVLKRAEHLLGHAIGALSEASEEASSPYQKRLLRLTCADAMRDMGDAHGRSGAWVAQEDALDQALEIFQAEEDVQGECRVLVLKTRMFRQSFESALSQGRTLEPELLKIAHDTLDRLDRLMSTRDDRFGHALGAWEAAALARVEGNLPRAALYYQSAAEHFRVCHAHFEAALADNALGLMANKASRPLEAMAHFSRFRQSMKQQGHTHYEAVALNSIGWTALLLHQPAEANTHFEAAIDLFKSSGIDMAPTTYLAASRVGKAAAALDSGAHWQEVVAALQEATTFTRTQPLDDDEAQLALTRMRAGLDQMPPIPARVIRDLINNLRR